MSDSTDNTNELDSYGVWVKNTKQDEGTDEGLNFADSLDLPDFEETDNLDDNSFSDMFNEDDTINLDGSSDETTLTDDELMNITSGEGIEIAEAEAGTKDDSLNEVDFSTEIGDDFNVEENPLDDVSLEENSVTDAELGGSDVTIEEPVTEEAEDNSLDDFEFEDFGEMDPNAAPAPEPAAEEPAAEPEVEAVEEPAAEDVSEDFGLDNVESSEEEISLDDFMDSGFSDESVASGNNGFAADAAPAGGDSEEVSLDDFVDMSEFGVTEDAPKKEEAIADEKPLDMDISFDASADALQTEDNLAAEEMPDDDYEEEAAAPAAEEAQAEEVTDSGNDIEAEEVDLSDFGIDENAEETPVTQDVEGSKNKDTIVDYDLSVGDGNMNAAPVVNEIKSSANDEEIEAIEEIDSLEEESAVSSTDSTLLKQIVEDLSNLKEEINTLKNNLEEIKNSPVSEGSGVISEEIAVEDDFDSANEDTGFFSGDDGDDTIALSTDELSNIFNTAEFSSEEEAGIEPEAAASEDSMGLIDDAESGKQEDLTYDFTDENLSEPNLDEIEIDEEDLDDDLPDEISIPKEDDIFVESSSSDFMDSVQDTTEEHEQEQEVAGAGDEAFSTVDNLFEEENPDSVISEVSDFMAEPEEAAEPVEETVEAPAEEPVVEETIIEEPADEVADETFVSEAEVENDFVSHEDENNNLTDSNIDYLTTEEPQEDAAELDENAELKKDIKSVLLYMDQLLENLPEEKIVEFAKSDEFTTYKKLFSELGLS